MATKTKTTAKPAAKVETEKKADAKLSTKVVSLIRAVADTTAKATAAFTRLALGIREEAERNEYDESQARQMVTLSYREAYGMTEAGEEELASFDLKYRPDVSKVMRLAFPANEKAGAQLEKALEHNEGANSDRIGVNKLLEIARGNVTTEQVTSTKAKKKAAKGKDQGKSYGPNQFADDLAGIVSRAVKAGVTVDAIEKAFADLIAEYRKDAADKS